MALPEMEIEKIVDKIVGRVFRLRNLLQHDLTLAIDLGRREGGIEKDIGKQIGCHLEVFAEHFGVVAGVLLAGKSIEDAADRVDRFGDLSGGARSGALEEQMFDKVRNAVLRSFLIARAVLDPDSDRARNHRRHRLGQHPRTIGKYALMY